MPDLVLLRHGESAWNAANLFTGWVDVDLTEAGEAEARQAGRLLLEQSALDLAVVHTSVLTRAIRTANLALDELGRPWLPVRRSWRLNERHYGALQGRHKREMTERYGVEQVKLWRRSYDVPPPPLEIGEAADLSRDPRYRLVAPGSIPASECLADVVARMIPYWEDGIVPDLLSNSGVLVVAHGNSLRALVKYLHKIPDDEIVELEIPTGVPWWFRLDERLEVQEDRQLVSRFKDS